MTKGEGMGYTIDIGTGWPRPTRVSLVVDVHGCRFRVSVLSHIGTKLTSDVAEG